MKISIGENLRRMRLEKGLTQEQLAEVFSVSPQAISRWENDQAYPDVTLLPGLAMFYETSIDEIVGMEHLRKAEKLHSILSEAYTLAGEGETDAAIRRIRESLRVYPDNSGLLMALGETLARKAEDPAAMEEAIAVGERTLRNGDVSMKARSTTMVNLLFLYMKAGKEERAREMVKQLPHIWESREMVMPETYEGEEYREELKKAVRRALAFLCVKIDACEGRRAGEVPGYVQMGVKFENGLSDAEMMGKVDVFLKR